MVILIEENVKCIQFTVCWKTAGDRWLYWRIVHSESYLKARVPVAISYYSLSRYSPLCMSNEQWRCSFPFHGSICFNFYMQQQYHTRLRCATGRSICYWPEGLKIINFLSEFKEDQLLCLIICVRSVYQLGFSAHSCTHDGRWFSHKLK